MRPIILWAHFLVDLGRRCRLTWRLLLRPSSIDLHIKGFEALGAHVTNEHGAMYLRTDEAGLQGTRILWIWYLLALQSMSC